MTETLNIFQSSDDILGTVVISVPQGKTVSHAGIKVELLGQIGTSPSPSPRARCASLTRLRFAVQSCTMTGATTTTLFPSSASWPARAS